MRRQGVRGRGLIVCAALIAAFAVAPAASGQTLRDRLDEALAVRGVPRAGTGAYAFDLRAGRVVYRWQARKSLKPASNEKLGVALAALRRLGPAYRIRTEVRGYGSRSGSTWRGRLLLKGYGDPTLSRGDLRRLAARLRTAGIRRVTGSIVGDERYFDRRRTAPGWKASYYKIESPPLSALVVNRARVRGHTVDRPALAAAKAFRKALVGAGIAVGGKAATGRTPAGSPVLAVARSKTIAAIVRRMNKTSDNFYAEMLVKHLGAKLRGSGTTAAGCRVVRRVLDTRNVPLAGVRIVDGSGLSRYNRATARAVGATLLAAWRDPDVRRPFFLSLPIAGVDGTLKERMRSGPAYRRVHAKTGTLNTASALSGYVATRYVFSILQNDNPISWTRARRSQDRFAQTLARTL
jgi:serine-type D-Ala-D-Ala carboxypeptidase/endopeptidase (penicillin-binding protein 4)